MSIDDAERAMSALRSAITRAENSRWARVLREKRAAELANAKAAYPNGWLSRGMWIALDERGYYVPICYGPDAWGVEAMDFVATPARALVRVKGGRASHIAEPGRGLLCGARGPYFAAREQDSVCAACARLDGQRSVGPLFGSPQ